MSNVLLVGGPNSGEYHRWFGNRVRINRLEFVLHRAHFRDGTMREYYVKTGMELRDMLDDATLDRIEVRG